MNYRHENTGLRVAFQAVFQLLRDPVSVFEEVADDKKNPARDVWESRRDLKRPCSHPLSTGRCNCQASEEERLSDCNKNETAFAVPVGVLKVSTETYTSLTSAVARTAPLHLCSGSFRLS